MMVIDPITCLFIDPVAPRGYDPSNIDLPGLGGTEQTIVSLAETLGRKQQLRVVVEQQNRTEKDYYGSAAYTSVGTASKARTVIVIRDANALIDARKRFPDAELYLYSHDLAGPNLGDAFARGVFQDSRCLANICVSRFHATQIIEVVKQYGYSDQFKTKYIYNPISDCGVQGENYKPNQILWMASPHKGLDRAYEVFECLLRLNPEFRLLVTNPGYIPDLPVPEKIKHRVTLLGTLPHTHAIRLLRESLLLLACNTVFPETFGKILAEANAVGTPVLAHPIGAAKEVTDTHPEQFCDCRNTEIVVKRIMKWHAGARPVVRGNPKFKLETVIKEWEKLLGV